MARKFFQVAKEVIMEKPNQLSALSVSGSMENWISSCLLAAKDDTAFSTFRRDPVFMLVIEGTPLVAGQQLLKRCGKEEIFWELLPQISKSDEIGSPLVQMTIHSEAQKNSSFHISPTTMRYVNNSMNMMRCFGSESLESDIIEIGGGYGGEAKILQDFRQGLQLNPSKYTIFDLDTSFPLIERYLDSFGYHFERGDDLGEFTPGDGRDTLVLSNGALSEMTSPLIDWYLDEVVSRARYGYFITNFETHSAPYEGGWTTRDFVSALRKLGKKNVAVQSGTRSLSLWDGSGSKLVTFGGNPNAIRRPTVADFLQYKIKRLLRKLL